MKYQISFPLLVVFGLLGSVLVSCQTDVDEDKAIKRRINEKVFATSGKGLKPTETFELLQLLDRFYTYIAVEDKNGVDHKRVKSLIKMSDARRVHCGFMDLSEYDSLIETNSQSGYINIVEYLKQFKRQAFLSCKSVLDIVLETEKENDQVGEHEEEIKRFDSLKESILIANGGISKIKTPVFTEEALNEGIKAYIEQHLIGESDGNGMKHQLVEKLCEGVQKRHRWSSRMFAQVKDDYELIKRLEPNLFEAYVNYKICHDVGRTKMATAAATTTDDDDGSSNREGGNPSEGFKGYDE